MTKHWGPLGWATLHTIAGCYPDNPSDEERELVKRWFEMFKSTIVCPSCLAHFEEMFHGYIERVPQWNASRRNLLEFVFRAHNTVNVRTHKPSYSFAGSIQQLKALLPTNEVCIQKRKEYLVYIRTDWMHNMTLQGISNVGKLRELFMIEEQYWSKRSFDWDDLLQFSTINVSPISNNLSSINSTTNIPKLSASHSKGFSIVKSVGKSGRLSSLLR